MLKNPDVDLSADLLQALAQVCVPTATHHLVQRGYHNTFAIGITPHALQPGQVMVGRARTVRFLPKDWSGLKSPWLRPLILCGQHSLEIFCLGVFLAFAGHFVLAEVSGGALMHALVSVLGILIMWGVAWVISWYKHSADKGASKMKSTSGNADMAGGSI